MKMLTKLLGWGKNVNIGNETSYNVKIGNKAFKLETNLQIVPFVSIL